MVWLLVVMMLMVLVGVQWVPIIGAGPTRHILREQTG